MMEKPDVYEALNQPTKHIRSSDNKVICNICYEGDGNKNVASWTFHVKTQDGDSEWLYLCNDHSDFFSEFETDKIISLYDYIQQ